MEASSAAPVARLMVDVPLAHLDRPFDYLVPQELSDDVRVGSRVRVRFSGRLVDGFVLDRLERSEHEGQLAFVQRAVGEPVLTETTIRLCRAVADRYAGSFVDVVRLAVPPRHAAAERASSPAAPADEPVAIADYESELAARWGRYRHGEGFAAAVMQGRAARAAWSALPDEDWPAALAGLAAAALSAARGTVLVVPDARDLARLDAALLAALGPGRHVTLSADLGPQARYRRWIAVRRGEIQVVAGTRGTAYAPVRDLGFAAIWDDGDDLHDEPRSPYPHSRDVLALRSTLERSALLIGGYARSAETQQLLDSGWAQPLAADRDVVRAAQPSVRAVGDDVELARDPGAVAARLPSLSWRTAREALASGTPVLVQVPRRGYVASLSCRFDGTPARCPTCAGPLGSVSARDSMSCRWCGRIALDWRCPFCHRRDLRAGVIGSGRTAEELGRAFPGVPVRLSGGGAVLDQVPGEPALVVATPGAEPLAEGGYGAALLLDGWALLGRADLRAAEETLRRWMGAASLVRSTGTVVVGADAAVPVVQALIRWDPAGFAARELAERVELGFPPAVRMASLTGAAHAVHELISLADLPGEADLLGPVPVPRPAADRSSEGAVERMLIRVPRNSSAALSAALHAAAAVRSARKAPDAVRIELDPTTLL